MALQFVDGPAHRLNPKGIPTGEVAKQGAMAYPHPLGDGGAADLIGAGIAGEIEESLNGMGPALGGGDGGGPGHGGKLMAEDN
jgi:hypothetical protein